MTDRYYVGPDPSGFVLETNGTTTPLNAGATFTGAWVDVSAFSTVTIALTTDQSCTYYADFSPDGTNADSVLTRYFVVGKINAPDPFVVMRKYFRLRITNTSASNQTYLRAQSMSGAQSPALNIPSDAVMSQRYASISVRPSSYMAECGLGLRQGVTVWNKFGGGSPRVTVIGYVRDFTAGVRYEIGRWLIDTTVVNDVELTPPQGFLIPGSALLEFTASTDTNNTPISLRFSGDVYDDIGT